MRSLWSSGCRLQFSIPAVFHRSNLLQPQPAAASCVHPALAQRCSQEPEHIHWQQLSVRAAQSRSLSSFTPVNGDGMEPMSGDDYLASLTNYEVKGIPTAAGTDSATAFDLNRMRAVLSALHNPQDAYPVIHVAGTKGKGSVVAMLSSVLRAAGYRVGTYTSPHMHHISERIWSPSRPCTPVSHDTFEQLVQTVRSAVQQLASTSQQPVGTSQPGQSASGSTAGGTSNLQQPSLVMPTHFEFTTAMALKHFADEHADVAVIETGLGGTTDATNVFRPDRVAAAVITPIGLDHVDALGGSISSIAQAKAGIMKEGRPVIIAGQPKQEALGVLQQHAKQLGCPVVDAEQAVQVAAGPVVISPGTGSHVVQQAITIICGTEPGSSDAKPIELQDVQMQLVGQHQHDNVQAAVATITQLQQQGWNIMSDAIQTGLQEAFLPGRFQVARTDTQSPYIVLDGAHTADSARALVDNMRNLFQGAPIALVLAMAADKQHQEVVRELRQMAPQVVVFTSVPIAGSYQRATPPGTLAAYWQAAGMMSGGKQFRCRDLIQASLTAALQKARHEVGQEGVVVVTGSLHAVAAAMKHLQLL
eukprot:jgi/Chrzof1/425/Cz01g15130.t1